MKFRFQQHNLITKPNTRKKKLVLVAEISAVILVIVGSVYTFSNLQKLSFAGVVSNVNGVLSIQNDKNRELRKLTPKQQVENAFSEVLEDINFSTVSGENYFKLTTESDTVVFVSKEKEFSNQAQTLQNLLSKAKIESRNISLVDFRFDKVVVRYK